MQIKGEVLWLSIGYPVVCMLEGGMLVALVAISDVDVVSASFAKEIRIVGGSMPDRKVANAPFIRLAI
jgi:hypothetical protein